MDILDLNTLALDLVAKDFSDGHAPHNAGPTRTARALAIIHLAARDAYAKVTHKYEPIFRGHLPAKPDGLGEEDGISAALGAGIRVCTLLYRDFNAFISERAADFTSDANPTALRYGYDIAERWIASRHDDDSSLPQLDSEYKHQPGSHRPDPISGGPTMGRNWACVRRFLVDGKVTDSDPAHLCPPPPLGSDEYGGFYDEVFTNGRDDIDHRDAMSQYHAAVGIFWAYDGSNKIGTPPRFYNQVVVKCEDFEGLPPHVKINVLAAINAAMADAGIAAWYWKYRYDFWRPVVAIREADFGFGPTRQIGDGARCRQRDPFWKPLGAPRSNPIPPLKSGAQGANFTPNFPSYPSGHATFGCACFKTFALLIGKAVEQIEVKDIISDEFNGVTTDNTGVVRPVWKQSFFLNEAIKQNNESRIYLGVHWRFDVTAGEQLGDAIADQAAALFGLHD